MTMPPQARPRPQPIMPPDKNTSGTWGGDPVLPPDYRNPLLPPVRPPVMPRRIPPPTLGDDMRTGTSFGGGGKGGLVGVTPVRPVGGLGGGGGSISPGFVQGVMGSGDFSPVQKALMMRKLGDSGGGF